MSTAGDQPGTAGRRRRQQRDVRRHRDHRHRQQLYPAHDEHGGGRGSQGAGVELPGRVRPIERRADRRGDQERHEPVPRLGVRRQAQLRLERQQLANKQNGVPRPISKQTDWGYSIGGPVGKPGGNNKLFFFFSQEWRPRTRGGQVTAVPRADGGSSARATSPSPATTTARCSPTSRDYADRARLHADEHRPAASRMAA